MSINITRNECIDKMIAAIQAADHDQETEDYLTYIILAQFGCEKQINNILSNSKNKDFILDKINAVAEKLYGPDFQFTGHGFSKSISAKYINKEQTIVKHLQIFNELLSKHLNISSFITSGTLLGMIREGKFLGHDDDIDLAYISQHTDPSDILEERQALIDLVNQQDDMTATVKKGILRIDYSFEDIYIDFDLFTGYCAGDYINIYIQKPNSIPCDSILPVKTEEFYGEKINIPQTPESLLEVNYGPNWRTPDRSFRYDLNEHIQYYKFLWSGHSKDVLTEDR